MSRQRIKRKTWTERDTWRSKAFKNYRDSREWRHLLELNPSYDIRFHPAPGVKINTVGPVRPGKQVPQGGGTPGILKVAGQNLDLRTKILSPNQKSIEQGIFPWDSVDLYVDRLGDYTAAGLLGKDRINGYSIDSPQATSDTQRG